MIDQSFPVVFLPMTTAPRDGFEFEAICGNVICVASWNAESDRFNIANNIELDRNELRGWRPLPE